MAKRRQATDEAQAEVRQPARLLQMLARWRPLLLALMVILFVAGSVALWRKFGGAIVAGHQQYLVTVDSFEVSPQPAWIKGDVRGEVFYDAGWEKQRPSILETDLAVRVAQAFEQNTWVAKVVQVTKHHPSRVVVQLEYRRPVAMVEVDYQGQAGLLPVDGEGILLPPDNFTAEEAIAFPRVTVDYSGPRGSVGTPWGDPRVAGAASVAALLIDDWQQLGLHRVVAVESAAASHAAPEYELRSKNKSRVVWGRPPGGEKAGEASGRQKAMRLKQLVSQNGRLDEGDASEIDLRDAARVSVRPSDAVSR